MCWINGQESSKIDINYPREEMIKFCCHDSSTFAGMQWRKLETGNVERYGVGIVWGKMYVISILFSPNLDLWFFYNKSNGIFLWSTGEPHYVVVHHISHLYYILNDLWYISWKNNLTNPFQMYVLDWIKFQLKNKPIR